MYVIYEEKKVTCGVLLLWISPHSLLRMLLCYLEKYYYFIFYVFFFSLLFLLQLTHISVIVWVLCCVMHVFVMCERGKISKLIFFFFWKLFIFFFGSRKLFFEKFSRFIFIFLVYARIIKALHGNGVSSTLFCHAFLSPCVPSRALPAPRHF